MWMGPARAMADMAEHAMTGQGSSLVRRAAQGVGAQRQEQGQGQGPRQGPPQGPPPQGASE